MSIGLNLGLTLGGMRRGVAGPPAITGMALSTDEIAAGSTDPVHVFTSGGVFPFTYEKLAGSSAEWGEFDGNSIAPDGTQTDGTLTLNVRVTDAEGRPSTAEPSRRT
jgi:hypothetical protein